LLLGALASPRGSARQLVREMSRLR
jgi:hypothetical protein